MSEEARGRGEVGDVAAEELSEAAQDTSARLRGEEREAEEERKRRITGELVDFEMAGEGEAGEGRERSGTLPDSFGGTTGTSGRAAGAQAPGSSAPSIRGIDPEEARKRIGRRRRGGG
jgi:hypothetical protein